MYYLTLHLGLNGPSLMMAPALTGVWLKGVYKAVSHVKLSSDPHLSVTLELHASFPEKHKLLIMNLTIASFTGGVRSLVPDG